MLKSYLLTLCAIVAAIFGASAQIVTTSPAILQEESQNVVVYFHADQGNKALANQPASAEIYAHTGVSVINASGQTLDWEYQQADWNTNLPKCRLSYVSDNLWKLDIGNIREYYGVPANVKITKLDFVFRSADGKLEGKTAANGDIFVNVHDKGLQIALSSSPSSLFINSATGPVTFTVSTTEAAAITLDVNGTKIKDGSDITELTASYTFTTQGNYTVTATAAKGSETKSTSLSFCWADPSKPAASAELPTFGTTRNADGSVTFCVAAPLKTDAMIVGSWNDYVYTNSQVMDYIEADINGAKVRCFTLTLPATTLPADKEFYYYYLIDGSTKICDPYARLVLDPYNDKYISASVFPNLPAYPFDKVEGVPLAILNDKIADYKWTATDFTPAPKDRLMIYELLIRDFTGTERKAEGNGTVRGAIEKIPYLKSLGINAVELLPINEFDGNNSWGYNPNFYFAPDKAYGTPQDYKEFIDKCHAEGIAVILDMVFNQSSGLHPWYQLYTPENNPFYNVTAPHAYSVLNDWNQGYPMVQRQWKDVLQYWLEEYKVDGFRFDLVKGLGDNDSYANSGDAATNAFNQSRVDRMKALHGYMKEVNPDAYFINENLAEAKEENMMAEDGELNWANVNYAGCQYASGESSGSNLNRMYAPLDGGRLIGSTVSYLESHDEERLAYAASKTTVNGVAGNSAVQLKRIGCAAAQMIMAPGSHMIWQFSEMGNNQSTKNAGGNNTDPKIVYWGILDKAANKGLWDSYQQLIFIRNNNPELFTTDTQFTDNCAETNWASGRTMISKANGKELYVCINPNVSGNLNFTVNFEKSDASAYHILSQSYQSNATMDVAGKKVTVPANSYVVIGSADVTEVKEIGNETGNAPRIMTSKGMLSVSGAIAPVEIYDLSGRRVYSTPETDFTISLTPGLYLLRTHSSATKLLIP